MATDRTEPRTLLITGLAVLSIVTLLAIRFALQSYFIAMTEEEQQGKIAGQRAERLLASRREAEQRLAPAAGRMGIEQAMTAFARGERPAAIQPAPTDDRQALQGWTGMHRAAPPDEEGAGAPHAAHPAGAEHGAQPAGMVLPQGDGAAHENTADASAEARPAVAANPDAGLQNAAMPRVVEPDAGGRAAAVESQAGRAGQNSVPGVLPNPGDAAAHVGPAQQHPANPPAH